MAVTSMVAHRFLLVFLALSVVLDGVASISISTISATNETTAVGGPDDHCPSEGACTCDARSAILKCFCEDDGHAPLDFRFGQLAVPFDLVQIGACRRLTLHGQPFSPHPPEFVQVFDSDNVFHDSLPATPLPVSEYPPLATAARPIRRIEFLNVTLDYLALGDLYALNRVEQFIVQNSTVKVLGGRPPGASHASNMGSVQLLSSLFIEVRRNALDVHSLDAFLLTNSTVVAWQSGAVRLRTNEGARVVISECRVGRAETAALTLLSSGSQAELVVEGNHFGHLADDAFRLEDAANTDFRFRANHAREARPHALSAVMAAGKADSGDNVWPCGQQVCWGGEHLRDGDRCWMPGNGSQSQDQDYDDDDEGSLRDLTPEEMAPLPATDDACRPPAADDARPLDATPEGSAASSALCGVTALIIASLLTTFWSFMDVPV